jgi:hypothetical protein
MGQSSPPPLWLLDVDGVLNAVTAKPDRSVWRDWERGTATADGVSWPIRFSPSVTRAVARVHDERLAEVRWLTTWGRHANGELRRLLRLPAFEVAGEEARRDRPRPIGPADPVDPGEAASHGELAGADAVDALTGRWWKFDVVRRVHLDEPGRRIIWTDDDLDGEHEVRRWMRQHTDCLLLSPRTHVGLTAKMLRTIEDFCVSPPV